MKKIFTLFMATVVAMSMMAVPQVKKVGKKVQPTSKEQFEAKTPAQAKTLEMANDAKVLRSFERPETAVKKAPAKAPLKVAAAQAADTVKLHFDGFSVLPEYYEKSGDWYMACSNGEGWIVKFDILAESYIGTFTEADLDLYYSYIYTPTDMVDYEKVALTITETVVSQYCKTVNLHAVIDGTDGNVYVVTCVHNFLSPKATVEETITGASLVWDGEKSVITGKNTDLDMTLAVWATWPTGPFTQGELDMAETSVVYKGVKQTLMGTDMLVASTLLEDGNVAYVADVAFYNQDTTLVKANVTCPLPAATDTVNISLNNLTVDDSWAAYFGWVYLTGVNSEWDVYGGVAAMEAAEGTWASEDEVMLYITNLKTGEKPEAVYATATLVYDDEKGWLVTIEGYCTDGKYYVVDMKYEIPEPTKTVKISFDNGAKASFYPDMQNDLMLANDNGEYYVALDIYGVPMGGEFTLDNMDSYYTQLIDWTNMVEVQIADVKGVVSQNGDTTKMVAEIIGFDAVLYQVELWYAVPTPKETVTLTVDATFDNNLQYGYYTLHGQANEKEVLVAMSPLTEVVEGTYVNDGLFGKFGEGGQHDFYASYTYVAEPTGEVDEYGDPEYNVYAVDKVTMVVTLTGDDIVAKVSAICSNAVQYEITMTAKYDKAHLEYDSETPVERAYTTADAVEVEYDADYGLVYWGVEAADGSDMCALYFFVEEADAETVLPAGVYPIDDSQDYGTVLASTGYDGTYVYPSLYATYSAMNPGYLSELWFMVGGTVTVEKVGGNLKVAIDAINSYDQAIKITYDGTTTGVENTTIENSNVRKMVKDNQLIIIKDGVKYNILGNVVK